MLLNLYIANVMDIMNRHWYIHVVHYLGPWQHMWLLYLSIWLLGFFFLFEVLIITKKQEARLRVFCFIVVFSSCLFPCATNQFVYIYLRLIRYLIKMYFFWKKVKKKKRNDRSMFIYANATRNVRICIGFKVIFSSCSDLRSRKEKNATISNEFIE